MDESNVDEEFLQNEFLENLAQYLHTIEIRIAEMRISITVLTRALALNLDPEDPDAAIAGIDKLVANACEANLGLKELRAQSPRDVFKAMQHKPN